MDESRKGKKESQEFLFKTRQFLGPPPGTASPRSGHIQAAVQFIIPGLAVSKRDREGILRLFEHIGLEILNSDLQRVTETNTKQAGTLVSAAFYVPEATTETALIASIDDTAITIVERFLGMLSFCAGTRLIAANVQTTWINKQGSMSTKLEPIGRSNETQVPFDVPKDSFGRKTPTENIFIALFWLRRALAERDPLDTYAALMVSLQAIAREIVQSKQVECRCSECGHVTMENSSVTALVRELVVGKLGAPPDRFTQLWKARNAVVAHGNQQVDAGTFLRLTELKFEAANLCYKGIKLAMGLPVNGPPRLGQPFFVTSALMYVE